VRGRVSELKRRLRHSANAAAVRLRRHAAIPTNQAGIERFWTPNSVERIPPWEIREKHWWFQDIRGIIFQRRVEIQEDTG